MYDLHSYVRYNGHAKCGSILHLLSQISVRNELKNQYFDDGIGKRDLEAQVVLVPSWCGRIVFEALELAETLLLCIKLHPCFTFFFTLAQILQVSAFQKA